MIHARVKNVDEIHGYVQLMQPRRVTWLQKWLASATFNVEQGVNAGDICRKLDNSDVYEQPEERGEYLGKGQRPNCIVVRRDTTARRRILRTM